MILQNDNGNTRLLATKSSKWALYNTKAAAMNDLANIPEGTIVGILENTSDVDETFVPSIMDYLNVTTTNFPNTSWFSYTFTATENCFVSISQKWGASDLLGRTVTIKTSNGVMLRRVYYNGYGDNDNDVIFTDPLFLRTGQTVECIFGGYDGACTGPKLHVFRKY